MKITNPKKLIPEDFPSDDRELIKKLSSVINPFFEQSTQILSAGITLKDNVKSKVLTISLAKDISTYKIAWDINEKPSAVYIGKISKGINRQPVTQVYALSWEYTYDANQKPQIELTFLGLAVSIEHELTIVALV